VGNFVSIFIYFIVQNFNVASTIARKSNNHILKALLVYNFFGHYAFSSLCNFHLRKAL